MFSLTYPAYAENDAKAFLGSLGKLGKTFLIARTRIDASLVSSTPSVIASQKMKNSLLPTESSQFRPCQDPRGIWSALTKSVSRVTLGRPKKDLREDVTRGFERPRSSSIREVWLMRRELQAGGAEIRMGCRERVQLRRTRWERGRTS